MSSKFQIKLFDDSENVIDITKYTLFQVSPKKEIIVFKDELSFDRLKHHVQENCSSGRIVHAATESYTGVVSGVIYLNDFPVINSFSQSRFTPS